MPGLSVKSLTLSHYRSHRRTTLSLDPKPVAIFGPNGAGKTNILEAVSLLSPGRGLRRAASDELMRRPEAIGWKVVAEISADRLYEIETGAEPGQARQVRIDDKPAPQLALGRLARIVWLVPSMDRLWIEGADGRRRFLDRMAMSFLPDHADAVLAYEKAMRERNRLLKDMVRDAAWYAAVERQMADAAAAIIANRQATVARIAKAQDGAETAFPAADLGLIHPDVDLPETADDLSETWDRGRAGDLRAGRTLVGPHRSDLTAAYAEKAIAADQCSTGEQKALLVSLVLANARALAEDTGTPPLILLDEVAAHLDSERRSALYDEIAALGTQAWMTGTGPELFDALGSRAQYVEVTDVNGESHAIRKNVP